MTSTARALDRLSTELFDFARPSSVGERWFFRIFELFVAAWTLQHVWTWAGFLPRIEGVVLPLGLANYIDVSFMFDATIAYGTAAVLTLLTVLAVLYRFRVAYWGVLLLFHLFYTARYCLGEISHGSNFIGLAVLALAVGASVFKDDRVALPRFVFGLLFFLFGLGYTSAGVCKLVATGIDWPMGEHLRLWMSERYVDVTSSLGHKELSPLQQLAFDYTPVATAILTFGLLAELAGFLVWFRRTRMLALTTLILMHIGVDLSMDIYFGHNIYMLVLVAYPWSRLLDKVHERFASSGGRFGNLLTRLSPGGSR